MKGDAGTIEGEVNRMIENWGDEGEIDRRLLRRTDHPHLDGVPHRHQVPRRADSRFAHVYDELERGTDPRATSTGTRRSRASSGGATKP